MQVTEETEGTQGGGATVNAEEGVDLRDLLEHQGGSYALKQTYKPYLAGCFGCLGFDLFWGLPDSPSFPYFTMVPRIMPQESKLKQVTPQLLSPVPACRFLNVCACWV